MDDIDQATGANTTGEVAVLVICCVSSKAPATVNLMAPIGIGLRSRRGAQVIIHETGFTTDEPLVFEDR